MESIAQLARMIMLRPLIGLRIRDYIYNIYNKVLIVVVASVVLPGIVYFNMEDNVLRFFAVGLVCVISVSASGYLLGLSANERVFVKNKAAAIIKKITKR